MTKLIDLTGMRFDSWTVIERAESKNSDTYWKCKCECGRTYDVRAKDLRYGKSTRCIECHRHTSKHGLYQSPVYRVHLNMLERCRNNKVESYQRYGGRGISVCDEWQDLENFHNWAMANGWKPGLQIDRIDNDGDYEPSNCRFVTPRRNCRNRSNTVRVEYCGWEVPLIDIADHFGIDSRLLYERVCRSGWSVERAISEPVKNQGA